MHSLRTFIAVELSPDIRARASELVRKLAPSGVKANWVRPDQIHLTLKFLGETPANELGGVCQAVQRAAATMESFDIECGGAGAFPNIERPRTLWIGIRDPEQKLETLHRAVEDELAKVGFRPEHRRYQPHLTIGRVRSATPEAFAELSRLLELHREFAAAASDVSEIVVFTSELTRGGAVYEAIGHAELATGH